MLKKKEKIVKTRSPKTLMSSEPFEKWKTYIP